MRGRFQMRLWSPGMWCGAGQGMAPWTLGNAGLKGTCERERERERHPQCHPFCHLCPDLQVYSPRKTKLFVLSLGGGEEEKQNPISTLCIPRDACPLSLEAVFHVLSPALIVRLM